MSDENFDVVNDEIFQPRLTPPYQTVKGVHDILPKDHEFFTYIKKVVRHRARQAGFKRITTPIFEYTDVFVRGIGDATDIVTKEMYTFSDRKGRSLTLKPEGTAGIVRSYIQNNMSQLAQPVMLYYIEPHFRYDRPQAGRYRQFWQIGFEVLGESDPALDAQVIQIATKINEDLGLGGLFTIQLNTIGTPESRMKYMDVLTDFYTGKERSLCETCRSRLSKNVLRLLDCKEEDCQILAKMAPSMQDYIDKESLEFHEELKSYLDELGIEYVDNPKIIRGLDYYSRTVFEIWDKTKGAQNAIGGGGRYDGLVKLMGGPDTPAIGYACGIERLIANMKREKVKVPAKDDLHIFVAQLGKEAKKKCLVLIEQLREAGLKTMGAVGKASINVQLRMADKFQVPYAILIGLTEVREGNVIVRDMHKGVQETVPLNKVVSHMQELIGDENLDKYSPTDFVY